MPYISKMIKFQFFYIFTESGKSESDKEEGRSYTSSVRLI